MSVEGLDTPFILENGAVMQYALDLMRPSKRR